MVSIKSLAVILFAAAVTAIPVAGGEDHSNNVEDNSKSCTGQDQEVFCCNKFTKSKGYGSHVAMFDSIAFDCNSATSSVHSIDGVSGQSQCSEKAVCCNSNGAQNGYLNFNSGCYAIAAN